ncbi:transposase [Francisella tularensis]|uniref:transposase n=1 Tax=Francisella tularensis TaxID=263 RepID=UPI0005A58024|nr:transposase [Francisella tularensis]AJI73361.1 hypothetical protein AQ14_890 [Francisella tularensis subsp. novicida D9876]
MRSFVRSFKGIYTQDMTRQGSTAYDCIMMFKLLLLGQWYSLSDREKEVKELNSQLESLGLSINTAK